MDTPTKRLMRSQNDRVIAGVCGGLAQYFSIDPTIIRILFVAVALAGGSSILLYIVLWIFMPEEGREQLPLESKERWDALGHEVREKAEQVAEEFQGTPGGSAHWADRRTLVAIIIVLFGVILLAKQFIPLAWLNIHLFWPLMLIVIGIAILKRR